MKIKILIVWIILLQLLYSCDHTHNTCACSSKTEKISVYSDILNELIEYHLYDFYLGSAADTIFILENNKSDTIKLHEKLNQLQNELYDNPERYCTIYLDTILIGELDPWDSIKKSSNETAVKLKEFISRISLNSKDVIDSLNTLQDQYDIRDYRLCTAKIESIRNIKTGKSKCIIGRIALSKLYFNKEKSEGIIFYRFFCGNTCGKSELIIFENRDGRWVIKKTFLLSIS